MTPRSLQADLERKSLFFIPSRLLALLVKVAEDIAVGTVLGECQVTSLP